MNYFLIRSWLPISVFLTYALLYYAAQPIARHLYQATFIVIATTLGVTLALHVSGIKLSTILNVNVTLEGAATSLAFAILILWYANHLTHDCLFSITTSLLSVASLGWLYEIPFYHPESMFYSTNPLNQSGAYYPGFIHPQLTSLILLLLTLHYRGFNTPKLLALTLPLYLIYAYYMYNYANFEGIYWYPYAYRYVAKWLMRIPATLLLLSLLTNYPKNIGGQLV